MVVTFPPDVEKKIIALAALKSVDPTSFVLSLVEKELNGELALAPVNGVDHDDDYDPEVGHRAVAAMINRTPEQIKAAQERAIREFRSRIELPPGISAEDAWNRLQSDDQTDEDDPDAFSRAMAEMTNRTTEQIEATRAEVMKAIPAPLPIPAGKTVFDMFFRIRGEETEEQVYEALERLS